MASFSTTGISSTMGSMGLYSSLDPLQIFFFFALGPTHTKQPFFSLPERVRAVFSSTENATFKTQRVLTNFRLFS